MSWSEAFAEDYDAWTAAVTDDVPFYVGLARGAHGPLVELAVGTGRVAIPVARADRQGGHRDRLIARDAGAGTSAFTCRGRGA